MNHPRINLRHLSDDCIKAIADALMKDFYRMKAHKEKIEAADDHGLTFPWQVRAVHSLENQMKSTESEHDKIERFLAR